MISYYITWHMQARLAPVLFTDDDKPAARAARPSPVVPAVRSPKALAKAATKHTGDDLPVHGFACQARRRRRRHQPGVERGQPLHVVGHDAALDQFYLRPLHLCGQGLRVRRARWPRS